MKLELNSKKLVLPYFFYILFSTNSFFFFYKFNFLYINYLLHLKSFYLSTKEAFFFINLKTEQIKLTVLNFELILINNFTTGFILKLLNIKKKNFRRLEKSFYFFFYFLKKYLSIFLDFDISFFFFFYKFKFFSFIQSFLLNLSFEKINFFFIPSNRLNRYEFRRVSAIKKRIKKKLK